jgi:hypothetical protein
MLKTPSESERYSANCLSLVSYANKLDNWWKLYAECCV